MTPESRDTDGAALKLWLRAPAWEDQPTAALGAIRFDDAGAGRALLESVCTELRGRGVTRVLCPMDGDTWHGYRAVTESDGSPPFLLEPRSGPHDVAAFGAAGFGIVARYYSARAPLPVPDAVPPKGPAPLIRPWDGTDPEGHFAAVHELSCEAFAHNPFYQPLDRESFVAMYMPMVPHLVPDLVLMALDPDDGTLLGYLFGVPNFAEGPRPTAAILKTYASRRHGVGHHLAHAFHERAAAMGFSHAIHALIHEANDSSDRSRRHGGVPFRRYALFGRRLAP